MDTNQLRCFRTVYEKKSINQAAKELFITPQGLGRILNNLEVEMNTTLFFRDKKGVHPYPAADLLYANSKTLLNQFDKIHQILRLNNEKQNHLKIACARGVLNAFGMKALQDFIDTYPEIEINWEVKSNGQIRSAIKEHGFDCGLVAGKSDDAELIEKHFGSKQFVALVHEEHPFYECQSLTLEELRHEKILIMDKQYQVYHQFMNACLEKEIVPDIVAEADDIQFLYQMAFLGKGIGILLDFSIQYFKMERIKAIPLSGMGTWDIYFAYLKENEQGLGIVQFNDFFGLC